MPDQESTKTLEQEIRALEEKLAARRRAETAAGGELREERELFRDVLKEHVAASKAEASPRLARESERVALEGRERAAELDGGLSQSSGIVPFSPLQQTAGKAKAAELKEQEHHEQVEALVDIALAKGIMEAVAVARHLQNPHLLDDFHDALVDEYYEKLLLSRELTP